MSIEAVNTAPTVVVRPGRHRRWWVEGWRRGGRRVAWTWWPFERLARWFARVLCRIIDAPPTDVSR
jgi:hypothetical protein